MSDLSQYDEDYDETELDQEPNDFPDGIATMRVTKCEVKELPNDDKTLIIFDLEVVGGPYNGKLARHTIFMSPTNPFGVKQLKEFNYACRLNIKPGELDSAAMRNAYIGYTLTANKVISKKNEKYSNWYSWKFVSEPDGDEADDDIDSGIAAQTAAVFEVPAAGTDGATQNEIDDLSNDDEPFE